MGSGNEIVVVGDITGCNLMFYYHRLTFIDPQWENILTVFVCKQVPVTVRFSKVLNCDSNSRQSKALGTLLRFADRPGIREQYSLSHFFSRVESC